MSVSRIAEKAGVSIATVSRVINNSRPVNPKMAELVRKAMEELQLPPRQIRRRNRIKATDRHTTIAIVSLGASYRGWFEIPVIAGVVAELTRTAQDQQMGVLMTEMPDPDQLSPVLRRQEVDGALVFVSAGLKPQAVHVLRAHLPVVRVMGGQMAPVEIDHIDADNNAVGYLAGDHLIRRGVRRLAYLTTRPEWDFSKLRAQGFMRAAEDAGVEPTMYLACEPCPAIGFYGPNAVTARELTTLLARVAEASRQEPIGLFVSRDEETVQVYRVLRELGIEPGSAIQIVSCDNETVRLSTLHPRPASIDLVATEIARHAIRRLAARIKHRDEPPARILITPRLVVSEAAVTPTTF